MKFKPATMADAPLLYAWRNDPHTRAMSHNRGEITLKDHLAWLEKSLKDSARTLFICRDDDGAPIGVIRRDEEGDVSELSWTLNPDCRGRDLGKHMLLEFVTRFCGRYRAEVKRDNVPSRKMCIHAGFRLSGEESDVLHFIRDMHTTT